MSEPTPIELPPCDNLSPECHGDATVHIVLSARDITVCRACLKVVERQAEKTVRLAKHEVRRFLNKSLNQLSARWPSIPLTSIEVAVEQLESAVSFHGKVARIVREQNDIEAGVS